MVPKSPLVFLDRDGTVTRDENYYLGSQQNWKDLVEFLPGVVRGISCLNKYSIRPIIITNQAGVALTGPAFNLLTEERMNLVNEYIKYRLAQEGAFIEGIFACPFVDKDYVTRAMEKGRKVNPRYIQDGCIDLKPNTGLMKKAADSVGRVLGDSMIFMVGDRATDVQTGLNAGGEGILIASPKTIELSDLKKTERLIRENPGRVYVAPNFNTAAEYILRRSGKTK